MGQRLTGLLRGSIAALRGAGSGITRSRFAHEPAPQLRRRHPHVFTYAFWWPYSVRLALKPFVAVPRLLKRSWKAVRQLSGDDGYERYLAHHAAVHPGAPALSRREWFARQQHKKWSGIKRCC